MKNDELVQTEVSASADASSSLHEMKAFLDNPLLAIIVLGQSF